MLPHSPLLPSASRLKSCWVDPVPWPKTGASEIDRMETRQYASRRPFEVAAAVSVSRSPHTGIAIHLVVLHRAHDPVTQIGR